MGLFSYNQLIEDQKIYIPQNLRAFFGWHNSLEMHISSIKPSFIVSSQKSVSNELILTTIDLKDRLDSWKLRASFHDRNGIIRELTSLLKKQKIDILASKVMTVDQNKYLNVEFEINCHIYKGSFDKSYAIRQYKKYMHLNELENIITAEFISDILFVRSTKKSWPLIEIKRNLPLFRSNQFVNDSDTVILKNGDITIPKRMLNEIRENFRARYNKVKELITDRHLPIVSVTADPESFLVRMFVFFQNTGHLHLRVLAKNKIGTLATISEILDKTNVNINQMFQRVVKDGTYVLTDFLICHINEAEYLTDLALENRIKENFRKSDFQDEFGFKVSVRKIKNYRKDEKGRS